MQRNLKKVLKNVSKAMFYVFFCVKKHKKYYCFYDMYHLTFIKIRLLDNGIKQPYLIMYRH